MYLSQNCNQMSRSSLATSILLRRLSNELLDCASLIMLDSISSSVKAESSSTRKWLEFSQAINSSNMMSAQSAMW